VALYLEQLPGRAEALISRLTHSLEKERVNQQRAYLSPAPKTYCDVFARLFGDTGQLHSLREEQERLHPIRKKSKYENQY
jgi:hypothetical protein